MSLGSAAMDIRQHPPIPASALPKSTSGMPAIIAGTAMSHSSQEGQREYVSLNSSRFFCVIRMRSSCMHMNINEPIAAANPWTKVRGSKMNHSMSVFSDMAYQISNIVVSMRTEEVT